MKRSIDNVTKSDDTSQPAMMRNQQPRINTLRSSSDTPEHLESASNTKNSLATSFVQQDSVLTAEQIESLKGFDKEGVRIILEKITRDCEKSCYLDALENISGQLASFSKDELKAIIDQSVEQFDHLRMVEKIQYIMDFGKVYIQYDFCLN